MFFGIGNLCRTYDLHQALFLLSRYDMSLEAFYGKFRSIFEEIALTKKLLSLSEVLSRLRQATLPHVAPYPAERSALVASMGPYQSLGNGFGCGGRSGNDSSRGGRTYDCDSCDSGSCGHG
ncbi:hypothetical protein Acr_27g0002340 [Actinidia rufa]|uniref:Uncharacterized protein n=1 Tax=Actinidia rufa TaxID=165716 RepID=A0A7J0H6B4_9ERIC|nr:hypothetical protein Acr_27g0002340 [Actinidia rufa]